jgi:hypothetical protein
MELPSHHTKNTQRLLEFAVPILSFGGAIVAVVAEMLNLPLDIHYPAFGCVAASVILAYLAWIRPKKDIVAISTPIYAILFFLIPAEFSVGVILMILYATSLTILLIRLKRRFGSAAPASGKGDEGPLTEYITQVDNARLDISPETASDAGRIFIRFAHGEYASAAALAQTRVQDLTSSGDRFIAPALALIAGHDAQCSSGTGVPLQPPRFPADPYVPLFHKVEEDTEPDQEYTTALDNALLLLFAVAVIFSGEDEAHQVRAFRTFAEKLAGLI